MQTECKENLEQLFDLLEQLSPEQYRHPSALLSGGSIGQHIRHILEFYNCLREAYNLQQPQVNYDKRKRDLTVERDPKIAQNMIQKIINFLDTAQVFGKVGLAANFSCEKDDFTIIQTSFRRELAYCLEHSIHHQALIKIGLMDLELNHIVKKNFGVAPSTVKSRLNPELKPELGNDPSAT
jgi:uncharacterized damage-inducible protein DinB